MTDALVIGAGVNGLAAAVELARAGKKVLVLEARAAAGGLSARRTFGDGFSVPGLHLETSQIRPALVESLGLPAAGLKLLGEHAAVWSPEADGPGLLLQVSADAAKEELGRRSQKDAEAYAAFRALLGRIRPALEPLIAKSAPPLLPRSLGEMVEMGLMGLKLRGLGRGDMVELLRVAPMCVADWMRELFETEVLSASLALPAVIGDYAGPWSPGTSLLLILREAMLVPGVAGGPAAVVDALVAALTAAGGQLKTGARVERILLDRGGVRGVALAGGEAIEAPAIVAACSPRKVLDDLLPPMALAVRDQAAARVIRSRGTAAKVLLGLREPIRWKARPGQHFEWIRIGAHLDDLERSFDAAKYRRLPERPAMELWASPADAGRAVLAATVHGAPYTLDGGWGAEAKAALLDRVLGQIERFSPEIRGLVVASEVISPADLEAELGIPGGSIHHVERALDQMVLLRPARPFARYATPIEGLFLGSSGCHPGPGVTLAPGVLAARALLGR